MLTQGTKLGPYEVVAPLGAGGMGEVYRARDTRLGRDVAVKVLPERLSSSPDFRQRFEREARAISSLQHPHICVLHDIGRDDAVGEFLVMEFLEGETVAERLKRGKLPLQELLKIGMEMADALDKAHRKGVVHRDLKPANIMLTKSGGKLMDFGLAKPAGGTGPDKIGAGVSPVHGQDARATVSAPLLSAAMTASGASPASPITSAGSVIGTIQYMSPEQIEGKEADARSDIFAFGATLYEMATGARAFQGKSQISVASAILEKDPEPISKTQPLSPPALDRVIAQCLAKNPEDRFQSAHDVGLELKWIAEVGQGLAPASSGEATRPPQGAALRLLPWAAAGFAAIAFFAAGYIYRAPEPARAIRSQIPMPKNVTLALSGPPAKGAPMLSPDGSRMVFPATDEKGREALWVRPIDSLTAQRLEGTEEGTFPFWSPDSRYVGFFAAGKLKKVDVAGGPAQALCDAPSGRGGTWNRDGMIVFAPGVGGALSRVSASGGASTPLTHLGESTGTFSHRWPAFLPDGRHFLYWAGDPFAPDPATVGVYVGSIDSGEARLLLHADSGAVYAPPGYLLFLRQWNLMAQPFEAGSLKLKGEAFPIAESIQAPQNFHLGLFSISQNGLLLYEAGQGELSQFAWFDASGRQLEKVGEPGIVRSLRLSPDGTRVAYTAEDVESRNLDIWLLDLSRGVKTRFTFDPAAELSPVWSPGGDRVVYSSQRGAHMDLYVKNSSGAGGEELLYQSDAGKIATDWSRDGRYLCFSHITAGRWGMWILPLFGDHKPFPYLQNSTFGALNGAFSPDGHWLAYESNESGNFEVFLSGFPSPGAKFQVSQGGGTQPVWRRDGKALFYISGSKLMELGVRLKGAAVEFGKPQALFNMPSSASTAQLDSAYTVSPDGKRFLITTLPEGYSPEPLTLVTNWPADLKKQ